MFDVEGCFFVLLIVYVLFLRGFFRYVGEIFFLWYWLFVGV